MRGQGEAQSGGVALETRVKQQLLEEFNLHAIVRLPNGVFAPYTSIPTNLLFFDRPVGANVTSPATKDIWYYELPLPEGRKNYTKTQPMQDAEFAECKDLWKKREAGPRSWIVKAEAVADNNYNLDIKNPNRADDYEHMPPEQLAADIAEREARIAEIMAEIQAVLKAGA